MRPTGIRSCTKCGDKRLENETCGCKGLQMKDVFYLLNLCNVLFPSARTTIEEISKSEITIFIRTGKKEFSDALIDCLNIQSYDSFTEYSDEFGGFSISLKFNY